MTAHRPRTYGRTSLRVLIVDAEYRYSVGGSLCRGFRALGHDAHFFEQKRWLGGWADPSRARRLLRIATRPAAAAVMNVALVAEAFARRPDLIFVMKGFHVLPETVEALRRVARIMAVYHTDDLENPLNTNESMRRALPLWDVVFTPRTFAIAELRARGVRRCEHLPFGFDPALSFPAPDAPLPESGLDQSAVFVGTWAPEREATFAPLATQVPLRIWGGGWERIGATSPLAPIVRPRHLLDASLRGVMTQAGASLLLLRRGNRDRHMMRTFEIPACAGFMLAERSDEHLALFEEDVEAAYFGGPEELILQARRYLRDRAARDRIAAAGHRRVLAGGHRYQDRAARVAEVVRELL